MEQPPPWGVMGFGKPCPQLLDMEREQWSADIKDLKCEMQGSTIRLFLAVTFWKGEEIMKLLVSWCLSFWRNRMVIFSLPFMGVRKPIEHILNSATEKKCSSLIALRNKTLRFPPGAQGWMQQLFGFGGLSHSSLPQFACSYYRVQTMCSKGFCLPQVNAVHS